MSEAEGVPLFRYGFHLDQFLILWHARAALDTGRTSLVVPGCELSHEGAQHDRNRGGDNDKSRERLKIHVYKIMTERSNAKRSDDGYPNPRSNPPW